MSSLPLTGDKSEQDQVPIVYETKRRRKWFLGCLVFAALIAAIVLIAVFVSRSSSSDDSFSASISATNIFAHLTNLYNISKTTPSPWSPTACRSVRYGYNQSAQYVLSRLQETDLNVTIQRLTVPIFEENTKPQLYLGNLTFVEGVDFQSLRYGGTGVWDFFAYAVEIDNYGCNLTDFNVLQAYNESVIALIRDGGGCDYFVKGWNAQQANASAGIIHRADASIKSLSGSRVRKNGYVYGDPVVTIPFLSSTWAFAQVVNANNNTKLRWVSNTTVWMTDTYNIIAETKNGNPNQTVIIGSHLDGVPGGPGINDNGSGSSTNLELAINFAKLLKDTVNRVRFIWWASEEEGLLGAYWYVTQLSPEEKSHVALNINLDMLASPNGFRQVGNSSNPPAGISNATITKNNIISQKFIDHFNSKGLYWMNYLMNGGGSDFYPFFVNDIPAGCLATGAGALRTEDQRASQGGLANAALDPCYHQLCDTPDNVDKALLQDMATAVAVVLEDLSQDPHVLHS